MGLSNWREVSDHSSVAGWHVSLITVKFILCYCVYVGRYSQVFKGLRQQMHACRTFSLMTGLNVTIIVRRVPVSLPSVTSFSHAKLSFSFQRTLKWAWVLSSGPKDSRWAHLSSPCFDFGNFISGAELHYFCLLFRFGFDSQQTGCRWRFLFSTQNGIQEIHLWMILSMHCCFRSLPAPTQLISTYRWISFHN